MSSPQIAWTSRQAPPALQSIDGEPRWYAVHTRCRFEKKVAAQFQKKHIDTFLPLVKEIHQWSDRHQVIEVPLFPGYTFVRICSITDFRLSILETMGVNGIVSVSGKPSAVPDNEIAAVRLLLSNNIPFKAYPFLKAGQRVRIRGGCLDGLEGILMTENKDRSLVVSVDAVQRSLMIRIDGYDVEPVRLT